MDQQLPGFIYMKQEKRGFYIYSKQGDGLGQGNKRENLYIRAIYTEKHYALKGPTNEKVGVIYMKTAYIATNQPRDGYIYIYIYTYNSSRVP